MDFQGGGEKKKEIKKKKFVQSGMTVLGKKKYPELLKRGFGWVWSFGKENTGNTFG